MRRHSLRSPSKQLGVQLAQFNSAFLFYFSSRRYSWQMFVLVNIIFQIIKTS